VTRLLLQTNAAFQRVRHLLVLGDVLIDDDAGQDFPQPIADRGSGNQQRQPPAIESLDMNFLAVYHLPSGNGAGEWPLVRRVRAGHRDEIPATHVLRNVLRRKRSDDQESAPSAHFHKARGRQEPRNDHADRDVAQERLKVCMLGEYLLGKLLQIPGRSSLLGDIAKVEKPILTATAWR